MLASSKEISRGELSGKIFEYMAAARPILCIGSRNDFEIGKVLNSTKSGIIMQDNDILKLENLIYKTYYGEGIFKIYNPKINKILNFSRKKISYNFLKKIKLPNKIKNTKNIKNLQLKEYVNKKPKIVHIITGLVRGGAERALYTLLTNGFQKHTQNSVISLMSEGYYGPLLKKNKIQLNCLNMDRGKINIPSIYKLRKILIKENPDIIQGWMYHGNLAAFLGKYMIKKKVILSWNVRLSLEIFSEMKFTTKMAVRMGALLSKKCYSIIYNSTRSLLQHRSIGFSNNNDFYIPNGFDVKRWKPKINIRNKLRNSFGIPKHTKVIGYVGRGDKQKDLPNLFKAFSIVKKRYPNVILMAVGRNLKEYVLNEDSIIFLGQRSDVQNIMQSFDLLCLTSRAEGFPNVIGEAMSSGLPCVTTDVGDAKEIVGKTGWVTPPNNPIKLAKCLEEALNNPKKELNKYGKIAREKIIKNYSIEFVKNQYISLYKSSLRKNN